MLLVEGEGEKGVGERMKWREEGERAGLLYDCICIVTKSAHCYACTPPTGLKTLLNTFPSGGMEKFRFGFSFDLLDHFGSNPVFDGEFGTSVDTRWYLYL